MEGWIKLHRCLMEKAIFQNEKLLKVFIWCLLKASHSEHEQLIGRQKVTLQPGQFPTGRHKAAVELNMSPSTAWSYLKLLEANNTIDIKSNNKFSVVTVVNWGLYQSEDNKPDSKSDNIYDNKKTTNRQQIDTNKNDKNGKNEKNKELVNDLFSRELLNQLKKINNYPFDIEKDTEFINSLLVDYPTLDIKEELKKWATYKLDKPLTKKSNARSQFRNWCKNAVKWQKEKIQKQKTWDNKAYQPWEPPRD